MELYIVNYTINDILVGEDGKSKVYAGDRDVNKLYNNHFKDMNKLTQSASGVALENLEIDKVISSGVGAGYRENLAVETGDLIWFDTDEKHEKVKWCLDLGISVFIEGSGLITPEGYAVYSDGQYASKGNIYYCEPDLTGFNTAKTYYLTYEGDNQTAVAEYPIYYQVPASWYDYQEGTNRWANVVTVSDCQMSYWTWIPRYMYKVENGKIDVKFVSTANEYMGVDDSGNSIHWSQSDLQSKGYSLPDAFQFDGKTLSGIWVSKYEISYPVHPTGFATTVSAREIQISKITTVGSSTGSGEGNEIENKVTINISGGGIDKKIEGVALPYIIDGLSPNTTYSISVTTPTVYDVDMVLKKDITTAEGDIQEISNPDLTGFNANCTYYVTYDENNKTDHIGDKISVKNDTVANTEKKIAANPPENWYDYTKQRWANIVTITEDGRMSYWTWIPRYQYKVNEEGDTIDCVFITKNTTTATKDYFIPESFTFGDKQVSGIWVSKYEVENVMIPIGFSVQSFEDSIKITNLNYSGGSSVSSGNMPNTNIKLKVTSGGSVIKDETISLPSDGYTITGLSSGTNYKISLDVPLAYKNASGNVQYAPTITKDVSTLNSGASAIEAPDLKGFNPENTYYITYDSLTANAKIAGHINESAPAGWYDYANKKWANIAVSSEKNLQSGTYIVDLLDSVKINMFVWIPRYEYKVDEAGDTVDARYISKNASATAGYSIPESFMFGGNTLGGIWVGKYEVQSVDPEDFSN